MSEIKRKRKANEKEIDKSPILNKSEKKVKFSPLIKIKKQSTLDTNSSNTIPLEEVMEKFDDLFLSEEKFNEKRIKDFSKDIFFVKSKNKTETPKLNYNNLFIIILKFSGLEIEQTPILKNLIQKVDEENFADFQLIEDIIAQTKVKNGKFKTTKLYQIFESLISEIYNNYDVTNEADFLIFKKFILNCLKLSLNKFRKIRFYSTLILMNVFKLSFEELNSTKKILNQKSNGKKKTSLSKNLDSFVKAGDSYKSIEENTLKLLNSKMKILGEICQILKEKFIFKKILDVSKNIRLIVCDYIIKISKSHFVELFSDKKLIKFYPFFLIDASNNIKSKYLQLIYEKLDLIEEIQNKEDSENSPIEENSVQKRFSENLTINTIIEILSIARDSILNICVKEDKLIAKQAIRIIELLSQHNILENKTVQALLPHLFNPEIQIRNLISKVVVNYILNFEKVGDGNNQQDEEEVEDSNMISEDNSKRSKLKKNFGSDNFEKFSSSNNPAAPKLENLIEMLEFFYKLADNEEKMIKVLVDNFYDQLSIFKHFNLFFDLIYFIVYNANNQNFNIDIKCDSNCLLQTCLIVLNSSIEKIQNEIEKNLLKEKNSSEVVNENSSQSINQNLKNDELALHQTLIAKNEEFINLLLNNATTLIKKLRINLNSTTQFENFTLFLNLFDKFTIYPRNLIKFDFELISELAKELKNSFFTNVNFLEDDSDEMSESLFENLNEMLLKGLRKLINHSTEKFHRLQSLDEIIYSENSSSLAKDFREMLFNVICKSEIFQKLSKIPVDEYEANLNLNLNNNFNNLIKTFNQNQMKNFYILISQFNNLLIYFKDIFNFMNVSTNSNICNSMTGYNNKNLSNIKSNSINFFDFSNFLQNLIRFVLEKSEKTDLNSLNLIYKISEVSLKSIETIHLVCFSNILTNSNSDWKEIDSYVNYRNKIFFTISYLVDDLEYVIDMNQNNLMKKFNNIILKLKTVSLNLILEMFIYVSSERIQNLQLKFNIDEKMTEMIENFFKKNFIIFYVEYNRYLREKLAIQSEEIRNQNVSQVINMNTQNLKNSSLMENSIFIEELSLKTLCLKSINEKFSKLLIFNLGIFKYTNFCCVYFESLYLVKLPIIIENLNTYVYENLMEKEISHFVKSSMESKNNQMNPNYQNSLNILIFYLTKITMRIFTNKSKLFSKEISENDSSSQNNSTFSSEEEKIEMITRLANYYFKGMKKMKNKNFLKENENVEISKKDKLFYENFIINSINFALESKKEIFEEEQNQNLEENNSNDSEINNFPENPQKLKKIYRIDVENVKFFEIIKFYLKNSIFFNENDLKNILMIFIKLSKNVLLMENVNRSHIKIIEKFKTFLLNKAKVFISETEKKNMDENIEMKEAEENINSPPRREQDGNFEQEEVDESESEMEQKKMKTDKTKKEKGKKKDLVETSEKKKKNKKRKYKEVKFTII